MPAPSILPRTSLIDQTTPSAALDALHHQHVDGRSSRIFVTQRNAYSWVIACSVVTNVYR